MSIEQWLLNGMAFGLGAIIVLLVVDVIFAIYENLTRK
jgi:hypothetical protein